MIIGNGIAGITAARHIRRNSEKKITVISAESEYFFARTALMYLYMGHLKWENLKPYEDWFWEKNRIDLKKAYVQKVLPKEKLLETSTGEKFNYEKLILATGSKARKLDIAGEDLAGIQGLVSLQDLELLEKNSVGCRAAVIIGGGLIGVELAEMLHTRDIEVHMLIRETAFWGNALPPQDADFVSRHIASRGINLHFEETVEKFIGNDFGRVSAVKTASGKEFSCQMVGVAIGVQPNISFLQDSGIETEKGILVDEFLQTSADDIFAIGDCAQLRNPPEGRKPVEQLWYTSRMMGETLAQTICGNEFRYNPGNWFNSAKFFDLEYQTYGKVAAKKSGNEEQLHWESQKGEQAATIAYSKEDFSFLGINTFGIRMRQGVFDQWLKEEREVDYVLQHLKKANFDPEFYDRHQKEIFQSFSRDLKKVV